MATKYPQVKAPVGGFDNEQLFDVVARLGFVESVKCGVFNNLKNVDGSVTGGVVTGTTLNVKASATGQTYGSATLDLTPYALTGKVFSLGGVVVGGQADAYYVVTFRKVSETSAVVYVTSVGDGFDTVVADLDVSVNVTITVAA